VSKTVLFVTYHFPPSAASGTHRILGFARHLPEFDWRVVVVAPPGTPFEPVDEALLNRVPVDTRVYHVNFPAGRAYWPLRKIAKKASWLPFAIAALPRIMAAEKPDVVVTSGPPHCVHTVGRYLKRRFGVRWLADFRDPWMTTNYLSRRRKWYDPLARREERRVFNSTDAIIVNAPNAGKALAHNVPRHAHKIRCVTNGYDPAPFAEERTRESKSRFVITHAGELYAGRDPRPFLDAFDKLLTCEPESRERVSVDFVGPPTGVGFNLHVEVARRGLSDVVQLSGQVPYEESLDRMAKSDLLLLIDNPDRRIGVPAKLYEYLGANRPILALAAADSDVAWVLRKARRTHRLAAANDPNAIRTCLQELLRLGGDDGSEVTAHCFSRRELARQLGDYMDQLLSQSLPNARAVYTAALQEACR
jgi:glycosyltransferase involved in cell wall biosynthesis